MFIDIETPSVVIDVEKVKKNISEMASSVSSNNCTLRPHIKTHKIPELAKLQIENGSTGITCAKVSEAEVMADAGISDIFLAYPTVGNYRVERALELSKRVRLILGVDSIEGAQILSSAVVKKNIDCEVRLEIDTGLRRTGIQYDKAVDAAKIIAKLPGISLTGIFTFRGLSLDGKKTDKFIDAGVDEGEKISAIATLIRNNGINIKDVSCGSTPTGKYAAGVDGVTEVRPGTYIFNDIMQVKSRVAKAEECAASVLVTVISTPYEDTAIVDGGSKAISTDTTTGVFPFFFEGYGKIVGRDNLILAHANEEHGIIKSNSGGTGLRIGDRLLIIPNHICTTINLHDHVYFLNADNSLRKVCVEARGKLY